MRCLLFKTPFANGKPGFHVRAVSWDNPEELLTPMWVSQTPIVIAWLTKYGNPEWQYQFDRRKNCLSLRNRLGFWPDPIDVPIEKVPEAFDDEIPF